MKRFSLACILTGFLVSACGIQPSATIVAIPTQTEFFTAKPKATTTSTPKPTDTVTPEPSVTPEAVFTVCPIENYKDCVIPAEALLDGTHKTWLESLSPTHFDPKNINDVSLVHWSDGQVFYSPIHRPNFTGGNTDRTPFNRNRTFGFTTYQGQNYLVMPIEYFDPKNPDKNQWVITAVNISGETDSQISDDINTWKNKMTITAWTTSDTLPWAPTPDPLIDLTLAKYPNLSQLVDKFTDGGNGLHNGDRTALDLPGLIVHGFIVYNDGNTYQ